MSLTVDIRFENGYLHSSVNGIYSQNSAHTTFQKIRKKCEEMGENIVIIEFLELTGPLSIFNTYYYQTKLIEMWREELRNKSSRNLRFVYLISEEHYDSEKFSTTLAFNLGADFIEMTSNYDEKSRWLLAEDI